MHRLAFVLVRALLLLVDKRVFENVYAELALFRGLVLLVEAFSHHLCRVVGWGVQAVWGAPHAVQVGSGVTEQDPRARRIINWYHFDA